MTVFRTRDGKRVQVNEVGTKAGLPAFDIEILDGDGKVVEYLPDVLGHTGLTLLAAARGWQPA